MINCWVKSGTKKNQIQGTKHSIRQNNYLFEYDWFEESSSALLLLMKLIYFLSRFEILVF